MVKTEVMTRQDGMIEFERPLEIRVYWDSGFAHGQEYANLIFQHFSRNEGVSVEYNLGIPVYFFNTPDSGIKHIQSQITICFLFLDDSFVINNKKWNKTIEFLSQVRTEKKVYIIPVKFSDVAFCAFSQLALLNFIIPEDKTKNDKFLLAVAYTIYACLFNGDKQNKISIPLFLSHCKKSEGLRVCRNIKKYISDNKSPISLFFDENDIDFGEKFDIKIEDSIKNSTLVIIYSDGYSNREFCKREVLYAKQNERPIVLIEYLQNGEDRLFPYLGNTKIIKIEKNINYFKLIFEVLKESIRIEYFKKKNTTLISYFYPQNVNYKIIPYAPELLTVSFRKDKKETIIYPNPLLGNEELKILQFQFPNKIFLTPILYVTSSTNYASLLNKISVSFSISETEEIKRSPDVLFRSSEVLTNISRYLIACGAKIIYSGNLVYEKFNFLDTLMNQFVSYKQWLDNENRISTDFFEYIYIDSINDIPKSKMAEISTIGSLTPIKAVKTHFSNELNLALSYTKLRDEVAAKVKVSIFIGGKYDFYSGVMPGVLEEFLKAVEHKNSIYLIGAFGGITSEIIDLISNRRIKGVINNNLIKTKETFYKELNDYQTESHKEKIDFDKIAKTIGTFKTTLLRNGLTEEENSVLFQTDDPDLISYLILKGLKKRLKVLQKR